MGYQWVMAQHLFVYGTLQPDHAPAELAPAIRGLQKLGRGHVSGQLYDLGDYPGATLDPAARTRVHGLVFALPDDGAVLSALDAYEGFDPTDPANSPFSRTRARVQLSDGQQIEAWMYVYNRDPRGAPRIADGRYIGRRSAQRQP